MTKKLGNNLDLSSKRRYRYKQSITRIKFTVSEDSQVDNDNEVQKYTARNEIIENDVLEHEGKKSFRIKRI